MVEDLLVLWQQVFLGCITLDDLVDLVAEKLMEGPSSTSGSPVAPHVSGVSLVHDVVVEVRFVRVDCDSPSEDVGWHGEHVYGQPACVRVFP